jgi:Xaa-Pro aminopeptidase
VREVDVALEIERFVRSEGGDGMAFDVIVASGPRSAMPHGTASPRRIGAGELVTIDMGARVDGYCADMTRTVAVGPVAASHRALFDAVLEAQLAARGQVGPGVAAADLDATAREVLEGHGLGEAFAHSLGHGVGLDVHEGPALSARSDDVLEAGMIVTIEPGAYRPGDAGVRIEDLVLVTEAGHEVLSEAPSAWRELPTDEG